MTSKCKNWKESLRHDHFSSFFDPNQDQILIENLHVWSFFQKNVLQLIRKTGTIFMSLKLKNREEIPENNHFLWLLTLAETKFWASIPKNEIFWTNLNFNFISKTDYILRQFKDNFKDNFVTSKLKNWGGNFRNDFLLF